MTAPHARTAAVSANGWMSREFVCGPVPTKHSNRNTISTMRTGTIETHEARDKVMEDLQALVRDAETLLKSTAGDVSEKAAEARKRVAAALERAKATCADFGNDSLESARVAAKRTDETIRSHPYESIGIALGVGILIGALWQRR